MNKAAARRGTRKQTRSDRLAESARALRRALAKRLDGLSPERLAVASDFLSYLEERETNDATEELLRIPGFLDALAAAEKSVAAGNVTSSEQLRRKY